MGLCVCVVCVCVMLNESVKSAKSAKKKVGSSRDSNAGPLPLMVRTDRARKPEGRIIPLDHRTGVC